MANATRPKVGDRIACQFHGGEVNEGVVTCITRRYVTVRRDNLTTFKVPADRMTRISQAEKGA